MRTVLGLAIARDRIRAVLLKSCTVAWAAEAEVESRERLAEAVVRLLAAAPRGRLRRPPVVAAIGPAAAQVRMISGLPPLTDVRLLSRMIREGSSRFFLKNGVPLVTGGVWLIERGRVWAAAYDEPVVDAVLAGCRGARFRVHGVVPTAAVLGAALEGDRLRWADGSVHAEVELANGELVAVRRKPNPLAEDAEAYRPRGPLAKLGEAAWRYADAYGAAACGAQVPLALRPGRRAADPPVPPRWRLGLAAAAASTAAVAAVVGPGLLAERSARVAEARLAELAEARNLAVVAESELARFTAVLQEVAAFDTGRRSMTLLLAGITRALPEGNALVAFRVDSAGGSVIGVGPRATGIVAALETVEGIASPQIIGPVTRERVGDRELERVTVRFHLTEPHRALPDERDGEEGSE